MFFKKCLVLYTILFIGLFFSPIISGHFIKTVNGLTAIENVDCGDTIICYDQKLLSTATITHISTTITTTLVAITTERGSFCIAPEQQFFDPIVQKWVMAKDVTQQSTFLNAQLQYCQCLDVTIIHVPDTKIFHISTTYPHTFFITEQELLTHNTIPILIGAAWAFGSGLTFLGITLGTVILGGYVGVQVYNAQKQKDQQSESSLQVVCSSPSPDPDDDEKKRKVNIISKADFFKKVKSDYEHYKNGIYRRKRGAKGIEKAEYLEWDHLHGDVEAYTKGGRHLGSIDPQTLRIYKGPMIRNISI